MKEQVLSTLNLNSPENNFSSVLSGTLAATFLNPLMPLKI